ncbi:MAG: hypothetical protein JWR80_9511 [Bradyrhizobium sp.]|nr:hypothetical protein [Bradyrhizobium sp.]
MTDDKLVERLRGREVLPSGDPELGPLTGGLINPDGPEAADRIEVLEAALRQIEGGANLGKLTFELRVKERNNRLTWYAVNVLEDNLAACAGTATKALAEIERIGG